MHVFLQESEGGKQEVRVVNAWHQPKSTDTNLGTIASVFFFFSLIFFFSALPQSLTEVPCLLFGQPQTWGSFIAGRCLCRSFPLPPAWQALVLLALPRNAAASRRP